MDQALERTWGTPPTLGHVRFGQAQLSRERAGDACLARAKMFVSLAIRGLQKDEQQAARITR